MFRHLDAFQIDFVLQTVFRLGTPRIFVWAELLYHAFHLRVKSIFVVKIMKLFKGVVSLDEFI
jgi:hypothetical protein